MKKILIVLLACLTLSSCSVLLDTTPIHDVVYYKYDYPYRLESMLHRHYKSCNELNEWFSLDNPNEFLNKCVELSGIIDTLKDNPFFNKGLK